MEYTQEQLDQMMADAKVEAVKGLYTEDDLQKKVTSEVDRRVDSGIKTGVETQRVKWEQEFGAKAKLSAEELAKKELDEQIKGIGEKEQGINKRSNMLDAKDLLSEAKVPKAHYDKFINMLVTDDVEVTKSNVSNFITMFNTTREEIEAQVKLDGTKIPKPKSGESNDVVTRDIFNKKTFAEKVAFKTTNPELYAEFMK